jgi:hypothetical protein
MAIIIIIVIIIIIIIINVPCISHIKQQRMWEILLCI